MRIIIDRKIDMMKNLKFIKVTVMMLALVVMSTVSCSDEFLEVAPAGSLSQAELTTLSGLEGTLIGAYSQLLGRSGFYTGANNWFWGSVMGGDANKGTDAGDQSQMNEIQFYAVQTNNASVLQKYQDAYEGVARCNTVLQLCNLAEEEGQVSPDDIKRIRAEARFLRGHYYFDLKKNFNDTPYVDETWDEITPVPNNQNLWGFIEQDFQFAISNLPETQSEPGRANIDAAIAYLGKAYLFQDKWPDADNQFSQIIDGKGVTASGESYALLPYYGNAFRSTFDNSSESVFAAQAAANTGNVANANPAFVLNFPHGSTGPARPGGCCGFNQPSFELVNSYRTEGGLPLPEGTWNDAANEVVSDFGLQSADPFVVDTKPIDPRVDHNTGRRGIPYLDWGPHPGFDWIRNQPNGGPFSPKKFIYYSAGIGVENDVSSWTPGYTAVNYNVIRYADVLLMAAEAKIMTGDAPGGINLINQVRARAATSFIPGSPAIYECAEYNGVPADAMEALRVERKLELSGEGHRFYDLVRWGIAEQTMNDYLAYETQFIPELVGAVFTSKNLFLPIPQNEIDLQGSDVLAQNPGY
jgi:hypothetical protein